MATQKVETMHSQPDHRAKVVSVDTIDPGDREVIVVGLDASAAARSAVEWAADEAALRGADLRLTSTYALPGAGRPGYRNVPDDLDADLRGAGQELLDRVAADLGRSHPTVRVTTCLTQGGAATAIRGESGNALLTVVGSRGTGRVFGMLLGSVASAIATGNPAPVVVVHRGCRPGAAGPVVIGVDNTPDSEPAIAFAFEAAALRHTDLIAVRAWTDNAVGAPYPLQPPIVAPSVALQEEQSRLLSERLAGWNDRYPDVKVQQCVVARRPLPTLLEYAAQAQLVVVGSHGRGNFAGLLLGPTGRSLVARCRCPVVIVNRSFSRGGAGGVAPKG